MVCNFVDFCILGLRCSWWHSRQANDTVGSERYILAKIRIIDVLCVAVNPIVPILRGLDDGRK